MDIDAASNSSSVRTATGKPPASATSAAAPAPAHTSNAAALSFKTPGGVAEATGEAQEHEGVDAGTRSLLRLLAQLGRSYSLLCR